MRPGHRVGARLAATACSGFPIHMCTYLYMCIHVYIHNHTAPSHTPMQICMDDDRQAGRQTGRQADRTNERQLFNARSNRPREASVAAVSLVTDNSLHVRRIRPREAPADSPAEALLAFIPALISAFTPARWLLVTEVSLTCRHQSGGRH